MRLIALKVIDSRADGMNILDPSKHASKILAPLTLICCDRGLGKECCFDTMAKKLCIQNLSIPT